MSNFSNTADVTVVVFLQASGLHLLHPQLVHMCVSTNTHIAICTVNMGWGLTGLPPAPLGNHQRGSDREKQTDGQTDAEIGRQQTDIRGGSR